MRELIPKDILQRLEEFAAKRLTGQIVLNVYDGGVVSADVREHIKSAPPKKGVDKRVSAS